VRPCVLLSLGSLAVAAAAAAAAASSTASAASAASLACLCFASSCGSERTESKILATLTRKMLPFTIIAFYVYKRECTFHDLYSFLLCLALPSQLLSVISSMWISNVLVHYLHINKPSQDHES
jgi:hypothetical protein